MSRPSLVGKHARVIQGPRRTPVPREGFVGEVVDFSDAGNVYLVKFVSIGERWVEADNLERVDAPRLTRRKGHDPVHTFRASADLVAEARRVGEQQGESLSDVIRAALERYVRD